MSFLERGIESVYGFAPPMLLWRIRYLFRFHGLARRFRSWNRRSRRLRKKTLCIIITRNKEASDPHPWADFASEPFMSHAMIFP